MRGVLGGFSLNRRTPAFLGSIFRSAVLGETAQVPTHPSHVLEGYMDLPTVPNAGASKRSVKGTEQLNL